jgi:tRNA threonylcarbamoyladenosine biosynthesis protein TsaE
MRLTIITDGPEQTRELGERLGRVLPHGTVVLLHGDLGAGKTTLTQGIAIGLGIDDYVQSPTFTLVGEHAAVHRDGSRTVLYHLDLYRLRDEADLESFGFEQYLSPEDGVAVIEWPERAGSWLPDRYVLIEISIDGASQRSFAISVHGELTLDLAALAGIAPL